jgi:hypothetical protein
MIMVSSAQIPAEAATPRGLLANPAENKREKNSSSRIVRSPVGLAIR